MVDNSAIIRTVEAITDGVGSGVQNSTVVAATRSGASQGNRLRENYAASIHEHYRTSTSRRLLANSWFYNVITSDLTLEIDLYETFVVGGIIKLYRIGHELMRRLNPFD